MNFTDTNILPFLNQSQPKALDELPYGVVQMDSAGIITYYNQFESELAGISKEDALGKNFFVQIAPCTNNFMVSEKYLNESDLDESLEYVFTYKMKPTPVTLRLIRSVNSEHGYILVQLKE